MNHQKLTNEWRRFLQESPVTSNELSDEALALLFSDEISKILEDGTLHEGLKDRARSLAKKYGLPLTVATALLTGGLSGAKLADIHNAKLAADQSAQTSEPDPGSMAYYRSGKPPGYSDLSNRESIEKAWQDIESIPRARAPVSGTAPVLMGGELRVLGFSYIPAQNLSPDTILPMSLMTAQDYASMLQSRLNERPQELIYLKNMIFGDTGKWASGVGNELYKVEGNHALLPPEWSIAHEVYATAVEERLISLTDYVRENPDLADEIYQPLGVSDSVSFHEYVNDTLRKIGRQ